MEKQKTVIIVGTGISSIVIALTLLKLGYRISVRTKSPDPRKDKNADTYGATGNGRMGRFVTGFEGEPYLSDTLMYPKMQCSFQNPLALGGWLSKTLSEFSASEQAWLQKRFDAANNQELVQNVFENYYVPNNRWSMDAWKRMYEEQPFLFRNTDVTDFSQGVLRLYDNGDLLDFVIGSHKKYGFLKQVLSVQEIKNRFPVYGKACDQRRVAGGIIAEGFSFNILQFVDNAIDHLEKSGVQFHWESDVKKIQITNGIVEGLLVENGSLLTADYYSINPGAYGNHLLENTPAAGKISGVAGRWLIMPRPHGYDIPTKIHGHKRDGFPVIDNNLTPFMQNGKRMLAVGGGYVFVGDDLSENKPAYSIVDSENERTMEVFLSDFYLSAKERGEANVWERSCIRSFTYDDVPIHEILPTQNGGCLTITAGTNTGTTTIAPYLGKWTAESFVKN